KQQLLNFRCNSSSKKDAKAIEISDSLEFLLRRLVRGENRIQLDTTGFTCDTDINSEVCVANGPVRIANNSLTVYIESSQSQVKRVIRPYPSKLALDYVTPFVIIDYKPWWVSKYSNILSLLTRYEVINPAADGNVHCFPAAVIGLKYHGFLSLNSTDIPGGYSMVDFKRFLREAYSLKIKNVSEIQREKPVLIFISRGNSRKFLNEDEMVVMIEELGFQVVVTRPNRMSNLNKFTEVVNSCSVLVGAHGAGLTTELFLPAGAVMVQVVPLGLEWGSTYYFGVPAREMGVQYLEYKTEPEESTLSETYSRDDPIITDPASLFAKDYFAARAVYIDAQNLKINLTRFRQTIVQAMEHIRMSSPLD
ncbi:hypothetical protein CICLE_v10010148mg, partial [Citrus x clementina]